MSNANLTNANLSGADVWNANFKGTRLLGANMTCTRINDILLEGALFDKDTTWPPLFNPLEYGAIKV
nr:pentapeptide repeat-containing protein [Paenibacillus apiarius]